jgi:transcriptional regulator with XRE-family HTH domain
MAHPIDIHIGQRVRLERVKAGLTQQELAARVGVKFQQMQKYETAANRISGSRLWLIAQALGLHVREFFPAAAMTPTIESEFVNVRDLRLVRDLQCLDHEKKQAVVNLVRALSRDGPVD